MTVDMNHLRVLATVSMNRLCMQLEQLIDYLPENDKTNLANDFDEAAYYVNAMNSIFCDGEEHYSDLSNIIEVMMLNKEYPEETEETEETEEQNT